MAYASTLLRDPWATYREIDIAGRTAQAASGPALVQLLYAELVAALRAAACAVETRSYRIKSERVTRATAILFALEANLDFEQGGEVVAASIGDDPRPFRATADTMAEIAAAWATATG